MLLVVGGCAAQKDRELVRARAPWVDVVLGTHNLDRVLDLLDHAEEWGPVVEVVDELQAMPSSLPTRREVAHSAWVTIQVGCNNTCTFCIVPAVRGREISRRPGDIIREVEQTGRRRRRRGDPPRSERQHLRSRPGHRRAPPPDLRRPATAGSGRWTGSAAFGSPAHIPQTSVQDVAEAMAETPAVCEQLHLPLQSGSDRVLARMHRGYTADRYLDKLELAKRTIPDLAVSTDIIVGLPRRDRGGLLPPRSKWWPRRGTTRRSCSSSRRDPERLPPP